MSCEQARSRLRLGSEPSAQLPCHTRVYGRFALVPDRTPAPVRAGFGLQHSNTETKERDSRLSKCQALEGFVLQATECRGGFSMK